MFALKLKLILGFVIGFGTTYNRWGTSDIWVGLIQLGAFIAYIAII